ncbi:MAG: hypothetical protein AAB834_03000 [Patescibacteria group bacterium]
MEQGRYTARPPGWGGFERLSLSRPAAEQRNNLNRMSNLALWRWTRAWMMRQWTRRRREGLRRNGEERKANIQSLMSMARLAIDLAASAEKRIR